MKTEELWREVHSDLAEKSESGYKMAILDSDKLLRKALKEKGYPGNDVKKQLFWAGVNLNARPDLKKALKKKEEILEDYDYRLSSFELEDFLNAYRKVIERVFGGERLSVRKKLGIYFENYFFLKNISKWKSIAVVLGIFLGIKILSSTGIGIGLTDRVVQLDNLLFDWFLMLLLIALAVGIIVLVSFVFLDKSRKVKIKE